MEGGMFSTTWEERLKELTNNGIWFDDQFMRFTACFLKRDLICYTSTAIFKYCGNSIVMEDSISSDYPCPCDFEPLYIANIRNEHYQPLLPQAIGRSEKTSQTDEINEKGKMYRCDDCHYSTTKESNLKRHAQSKHSGKYHSDKQKTEKLKKKSIFLC